MRTQWTLLHYFHVPAARLRGPMIVGVIIGLSGATLQFDKRLFLLAQAVLGCMIAQSLSPSILTPLIQEWPIVLAVLRPRWRLLLPEPRSTWHL